MKNWFLGEKCSSGKHSKVRVTMLVGTNMSGSDKLPLLAIGKASRPRCFKGQTVPVAYRSNNRAWMTGRETGIGGREDRKAAQGARGRGQFSCCRCHFLRVDEQLG